MKKISNKGFTLIELLATILIIGLVLGITTYGIISSVNKAKEKSTILSLASIKEAARIYSGELGEDSWKNGQENTYFCVTIEELINKGLLNKNAKSVENGGEINNYVVVVKNKTTKVIEKEEILTDESNSDAEAYKICTGNIKNEDITNGTKITNKDSSTDQAYIYFTDAYSESENIVIIKKYCNYSDSSTNLNSDAKEGTITDNKCTLEGLTQGIEYWVRVCEETERESVSCDTRSVPTKKIVAPTIAIDSNKNNSVKITYNNSNIKGDAFYYFKSTMDGTSSISVSTCSLDNDKYTCENNSINNIKKDTWYKVSNKEISITYSTPGNITVTAETRDKSDNSTPNTKEFSLYKITFDKGNADTIGGQTNNIELMCLANKGETCSITSPSIEKSGYQVIGWNKNRSATTSDWNVNVIKSISSTEEYYPILKLNVVKIYFNTKGGTVTENQKHFSADEDGYIYRNGEKYFMQINYGGSLDQYGLSDYNNNSGLNISKTGYTAASGAEWKCLSKNCKRETYDQEYAYSASDFCDASNGDCEVTLGVNWTHNKVNIRFNTNGGIVTSQTTTESENAYKWKTDNNGLISRTNANGDTYSSNFYSINYGEKTGSDGLINYNNSKYLNITKTGYSAVSESEWKCSSGCTNSDDTFNQASTYNASAFCNASNGDCTVTLGVNWTPNTYTISYNLNSGSSGTNHPTSGTYNEEVSISNPTRTGYKFSGWKITGMDSVTHTYGTSTTTSTSISSTNATTFKNLRSTSGTVNFEAQWTPNKVIIKFNTMGGTVSKKNNFSQIGDSVYRNNKEYLLQINYGEALDGDGLPNYNNKDFLNISKTESIGVSEKEWVCSSKNCKEATYNQKEANLKAERFCDASNGDCTVTLGVNWEGYKVINDYRCVGSDYYYVTFCRGDYCYYNKKNCEKYIDNSGTLLWSNVNNCSPETIEGERCDVENNDKYFITVCTGGFCKYKNNNAISDIERCDLKPCPSTETGSGSGTSTTEKSGRCGGCVTDKDCVNASTTCNVKCINSQCVWFPYKYKTDKQTCSTVGMMCY